MYIMHKFYCSSTAETERAYHHFFFSLTAQILQRSVLPAISVEYVEGDEIQKPHTPATALCLTGRRLT